MASEPAGSDHRFVGRDRELSILADAASAARDGTGRLVVVSGPAGIGKSTLCDQFLRRARRDGFQVGRGRAWPDGGAPPLWPWTSVLTQLVGPEAVELLPGEGVAATSTDRFARFAAIAAQLTARSRRAPLAVAFDDAHAADSAALLLARFLSRTVDHCVLVVTRRSDGATGRDVQRRLEELERDAVAVPLQPFTAAETAQLLLAHGLPTPTVDLAPVLTRLTGGNPLLLTQAMASAPPTDDGRAVGQLVGRSLESLQPEHRDVVALAAIIGMEGTTADVAALVGGDHADVLRALQRATAAGLVDLDPSGWAFTHDLVRQAALGVLTAEETIEAHARAIDLVPFDDRPSAAARRAHHALRAADRSPTDASRAVVACRTAARALGESFDYERAAELLGSAVDQCGRSSTSEHERVAVLLEWADALLVCGRLAEARRAYQRAVGAAARTDDPVARARAALGLGGVWVNEHRSEVDRRRVLALQRRALDELPTGERGLAARLEVRLAAEAVYDGAPVEPVLAAVERAARVVDSHVHAEALSLAHHALLAPEHLERRLDIADRLITVAASCGDDLRGLFGLLWKAVDQFLAGQRRAVQTLSELRTRVEAVGCRSIAYVVGAIDTMLLIRAGRLDDAETAAQECFEHGVDVGDADATGYYGAHLITIRWLQDRDAELLDLARSIDSSSMLVEPEFGFRAGAAAIAARAGLHDEAAMVLSGLRGDGLAALPRSSTWLTGIANIVEAAAVLGDADLAREAYPLLVPYAERPVMPSLAVTCFGSAERALGLAARTFGDADLAVTHLQRAVTANVTLGHRPMAAMCRADLADALVARQRTGDRAAAAEALRDAADSADAMGMASRADRWRRDGAELAESPDADAVLCRHGDGWLVVRGGSHLELPDLVGFGYIAELLARPGDDIPALRLVGGIDVDSGHHDLIDGPTLQAYRQRVRELDTLLETARRDGPRRHVERLEEERDALRVELSSVLARSGRARHFTGSSERARTAVRKAITRAIDVLVAADPDVAAELRATITTGRTCAYRPDPAHPLRVRVSADVGPAAAR